MKAFIAGTVLACGLVAVAAAQTQRADTVLVNGKIVTVDTSVFRSRRDRDRWRPDSRGRDVGRRA